VSETNIVATRSFRCIANSEISESCGFPEIQDFNAASVPQFATARLLRLAKDGNNDASLRRNTEQAISRHHVKEMQEAFIVRAFLLKRVTQSPIGFFSSRRP
jgi:hypothetical protein